MNEESDRELLGALMDGSLDEPRRLAAEALVEASPALRLQLLDLRRLRAAIQADARHYTAPDALRDRIRAASRPRRHVRVRFDPLGWLRTAGWGRALAWQPLGATLGLAAVMLWTLTVAAWQPRAGDERLMHAAVATHLRSTAGRRLVDLASADRQALQPWLAERLAFSAPVVMPAAGDAALVGGRLDSLEGRSVAAVVYRVRDHVVNMFIWPADDDGAAIASASMNGFSVGHWSRGGLRYCVVSDLPRGQLLAFAESLVQEDELR